MLKVRGRRHLNNSYIIGFLSFRNGDFFIENSSESYLVSQDSLSVSLGNLDSDGTEIFGSFEINGEMTKGGDIITWYLEGNKIEYHVSFSIEKGSFTVDTLEGISWCFLWELFEDPKLNKALVTGKFIDFESSHDH